PWGGRKLALDGRLLPDWDAITRELAAKVEPGARVRGHARPVSLRAGLNGDWRKTLDATAGLALDSADIFGLKFGPTDLVVLSKAGAVSVDPIDVAVNDGRVHLEPELTLDEAKGNVVRLGPGSSVDDVVINDEVSHRVLTFVAPVFDRATRVRGRVSVE